ncbi:MAG: hypothetical protein BroJett040_12860 [Oligoflexia bacterium]|nr:MAG: hypothetical protein BroJett040_12860 [Oligoflexia bacterium]
MSISVSSIFNKSWAAMKDQLPLVAGLTLVNAVALMTLSMIPLLGAFLSAPISAGYIVCLLKIRKGEAFEYKDFFWGFQDFNRLLHLALLNVLIFLAVLVGVILLVIPGIYVGVAMAMSTQVFVLRKQDAVEAFKYCLQLVSGRWWKTFWILIVIGLIMLAGAICFAIGLLVSTPLVTLMLVHMVEAYEETQAANPVEPANAVTHQT